MNPRYRKELFVPLLWKKKFSHHFLTLTIQFKLITGSFPKALTKKHSTCLEEIFEENIFWLWKVVFIFYFPDVEKKKLGMFNMVFRSGCHTCSLRARWNILGKKKVQKKLPWFSDIKKRAFSQLTDWFRQSCWNSNLRFKRDFLRKIMLFEKVSGFFYVFRTISKKAICPFAFVFPQGFQN